MKHRIYFFVVAVLLLFQPRGVLAQSGPSCSFQPDGTIVCTVSGDVGDGNDDGNDGGDDNGGVCVPGEHLAYMVLAYNAAAETCFMLPVSVDNCTGVVLRAAGEAISDVPCELPNSTPPQHPCTTFSMGAGGVTCTNSEWKVSARVSFPEIFLDVRPYPATLVRWPTIVRNGGQPESSGTGGIDYISYGGGSVNHPQPGDWRDLRLTLTLRPAGPMFVKLPHIGDLILSNGALSTLQWEVPSHPEAGGGPLAGSIRDLDELPADIPVFVGYGRAPYQLFWELRYFEYKEIVECVGGSSGSGNYNCGGGTGHREVVGYEWKQNISGGEIPPAAVQGVPAALLADLNKDGTPDAYWDNNLTLRRMDDAGSISNPQFQRSWNWGGMIYWAVREGQGQIGWPGQ